jgi:hypothetical protein
MLDVREINGDGTAIVSTLGLRRVVRKSGEILAELLEPYEADAICATVRNCNPLPDRWAESIDYAEALQRASN